MKLAQEKKTRAGEKKFWSRSGARCL